MKKCFFAIAATVSLAAGSAFADGHGKGVAPERAMAEPFEHLSYGYLDASYIFRSFDNDVLDEGNGVRADISIPFGSMPIYAEGSYQFLSTENPDFQQGSVGLGAYFPFTNRFHLTGSAGGLFSDVDGLDDGSGYYVGPGFRWAFYDGMEIFTTVFWTDLGGDSFEDSVDWTIGGVFDINEYLGVKLGGQVRKNDQSLFLGMRVYF